MLLDFFKPSRRLFLKFGRIFIITSGVLLAGFLISVFLYRFTYRGKIIPGVSVSGISVGGFSVDGAFAELISREEEVISRPLVLVFEDREWSIFPQDIGLDYDINSAVNSAYLYGRQGQFLGIPDLILSKFSQAEIPISYALDVTALEASVSAISAELNVPSVPPSITVLEAADSETGSRIVVESGEKGKAVDVLLALKEIREHYSRLSSVPIKLKVVDVDPSPSNIDPKLARERAEVLLSKQTVLSYEDDSEDLLWELSGEDLVGFLAFDSGFDSDKIASYSATLAESINRPPQNALFEYENGRVTEFAPALDGLVLDIEQTSNKLEKTFEDLETSEEESISVELVVKSTPPAITTENVNSLGIRELLGRGLSTFHGSIAGREYNIALSASRIAGYLVAPGETFSFNQTVGDISAVTGYRQAYIIKDGRTILDDGGGVCQVSTTLFRAVLDAGLPIVERHAHSYRVGYYEQNSKAGYDATVFAPRVDLKFKNDTPAHILVQTKADTVKNTLSVEIYGTSDGRVAKLSNHRIWDVTPPPPDVYQDDPTLPVGTVKQVDWKAWAAKVKYDYTVERNGETLFNKTFYSNFQPWQSVFLRGTGGV